MLRTLRISAVFGAFVFLFTTVADARPLVWARGGDALTLDPHAANEAVTIGFNLQIYEPLVRRGRDGGLEPVLALSWEMTADPRVWEFRLRPGVTFQDGSPFSADDVVFSFERALLPTSDMKTYLTAVESVSKVDDLTVHVTTKAPAPLFPQNLTYIFMMSKSWAEANGAEVPQDLAHGQEAFTTHHANGTGAYMLVEREPGVQTTLRRYENYWGRDEFPVGDAGVTEVEFQVIASAQTRVAALLAGDVDFVQDMPVQDVARISSEPGLRVNTGPENRSIFLAFNVDEDPSALRNTTVSSGRNPFADQRVREAINVAIDREAIRTVVMSGQSVPAGSIVPPFVNGFTSEMAVVPEVNLDTARELMAGAGFGSGFDTTLHCPNDRYLNDEKICQAVVGMLARIGIQARLESRSKTIHFPEVLRAELDFYLLGWGVPNYDSDNIFSALYHSRTGALGAWNGTHYSSPDMDAAIEGLGTETNLEIRDQRIAEIWAVFRPKTIYVPIHYQVLAWGMVNSLDVPVHPDNALWLKEFRFSFSG